MGKRGTKPGGKRVPGSGRKKGTPNGMTRKAAELADQLGINPFEVLLHFAAGNWRALGYKSEKEVVAYSVSGKPIFNKVIRPETRLMAAIKACEHLVPKRRPVDENGGSEPGALPPAEVKNVWTVKLGNAEKVIEEKQVKDVVAECYDKKAQG